MIFILLASYQHSPPQFHRCWQKTQDAWPRIQGQIYSLHSDSVSFVFPHFPVTSNPMVDPDAFCSPGGFRNCSLLTQRQLKHCPRWPHYLYYPVREEKKKKKSTLSLEESTTSISQVISAESQTKAVTDMWK